MRTARLLTIALFLLSFSLPSLAQLRTPGQQVHSADSIAQAQRITPEELVKLVQAKSGQPLILNVGPRMLYEQAHITGSEYIGQGSDPNALEKLKDRVKNVPKSKSIVLYCGCCPWTHCPNVEPAFHRLEALGYTNVKVLYIATNFGTDWVNKGYPTVRGQ